MKLRKNHPRRNNAPLPPQTPQPSAPQKTSESVILPSYEASPMPSRRSSTVSTGDLPSKAELMRGMMRNPYVNRQSMAARTLQQANEATKLNIPEKPSYTRSLSLDATITTHSNSLGPPRLRESLKCTTVNVSSEAKLPRSKVPEKTRKPSLLVVPKEVHIPQELPRRLGANGSKFVESICDEVCG